MNTESTLQQLRELKLPGMEQRYRIACGLPVHQQPGAHEMIALLAEAEVLQRQTAKTQMLLQRARIRFHALPEQIHVSPTRAGLTKEQLLQLCDCSFVGKYPHHRSHRMRQKLYCLRYWQTSMFPGVSNPLLWHEPLYRSTCHRQT